MIDLLSDPSIAIVAIFAFLLGGIVKGAMGFGMPMVAIPVLTAVHSLPMALSIAIVPVIATNIWQLWKFRAHRRSDVLPKFLATGVFGLFAGALVLSYVRNAYLEIGLGLFVLSYLARRTRKNAPADPRFAPAFGFAAGVAHGTVGLSGLVGSPYFHALGLTRPKFIFCNTAMFMMFSVLHLVSLNLYSDGAVWIGFATLIPAFTGLWIGDKLSARLSSSGFSRLITCMLIFGAILPIWNGVQSLLAG
jgi:uncharacterized membrane protein YfcA